tara:strand:- start:351 stop:806 length:456 start_codon:yes stop_codon:yes gene_type:complete
MIAYSELLRHIKSLADAEDYINTATMGEELDLNMSNIFPLFNVDITGASFTSNATVSFDVTMVALDVRSINKENNTDKYYGNDNEIDNHNGTITVLNNIWVKMHREFAKNNITSSDNPSLEQITFSDKNLLDGWSISFTVELPSDGVDICL